MRVPFSQDRRLLAGSYAADGRHETLLLDSRTTKVDSLDDATSSYTQRSPSEPSEVHHSNPIATLPRSDTILFYAEFPLLGEELHDDGSSHTLARSNITIPLNAYLRNRNLPQRSAQCVMPTCIFLLSGFTLCVDKVLFRIYET